MRVFIAIELPEKIKQELYEKVLELYDKDLFLGKITKKENLHLTLKFLGEITPETLDKVKSGLRKINLSGVKISLGNAGVFNKDFIRIIWVKLNGSDVLQSKVDESLKELFKKEDRFQSHITLARVKNAKERKRLIEEVENLRFFKSEFEISSFNLMKSELLPAGPKYSVIESFELIN